MGHGLAYALKHWLCLLLGEGAALKQVVEEVAVFVHFERHVDVHQVERPCNALDDAWEVQALKDLSLARLLQSAVGACLPALERIATNDLDGAVGLVLGVVNFAHDAILAVSQESMLAGLWFVLSAAC